MGSCVSNTKPLKKKINRDSQMKDKNMIKNNRPPRREEQEVEEEEEDDDDDDDDDEILNPNQKKIYFVYDHTIKKTRKVPQLKNLRLSTIYLRRDLKITPQTAITIDTSFSIEKNKTMRVEFKHSEYQMNSYMKNYIQQNQTQIVI